MTAFPETQTLPVALAAALQAGAAIMTIYDTDFQVEEKDDKSPLTEADRAAHGIISRLLADAFPTPVLSEEAADIPHEERRRWDRFWLVDPLDGTKEFIKKNGEFTVNIALIEQQRPVLGVVYAPARGLVYFASPETGARRARLEGPPSESTPDRIVHEAETLPVAAATSALRVVASRSHCNEETQSFIAELEQEHGTAERVSIGSSLKLCLVAEGSADVYPRIAPTMEWDTAAADAVVRATGGTVVEHPSGAPLIYNKPDLHNPHFVVRSRAMSQRQTETPSPGAVPPPFVLL